MLKRKGRKNPGVYIMMLSSGDREHWAQLDVVIAAQDCVASKLIK
jgi:hypothetical protein